MTENDIVELFVILGLLDNVDLDLVLIDIAVLDLYWTLSTEQKKRGFIDMHSIELLNWYWFINVFEVFWISFILKGNIYLFIYLFIYLYISQFKLYAKDTDDVKVKTTLHANLGTSYGRAHYSPLYVGPLKIIKNE